MSKIHSKNGSYIKNKRIGEGQLGNYIPILFSPTGLSESVASNYDQQSIPGRSGPIISYSNTGARQVTMSLMVSPDYLPVGYSSVSQYVNAIKALEYPEYNNEIILSPNCYLHLPNLEIDGVCTSVNISYKTDRLIGNSFAAEIDLSFMEVNDNIRGAVNIINGGYATSSSPSSGSNSTSYNDFVTDVSPKLVLSGSGLTISDAIAVDHGEWSQYTISPLVSKLYVSYYIYKNNTLISAVSPISGKTFTSTNILTDNGKQNMWILLQALNSYIKKNYKSGDSITYYMKYSPTDNNGNVYTDYVRYRYYITYYNRIN